ncbi:hypothetical protein F4561_006362 [Lipingzhangella halophila]|uniref:Uncharacterized protein n=1 Tax=Lipingzhangella halophila TaxID=1783352 RepID=A0A7W7RPX2_9ACTN|nr:hypothetical protein [Lipingzhangella halophila]
MCFAVSRISRVRPASVLDIPRASAWSTARSRSVSTARALGGRRGAVAVRGGPREALQHPLGDAGREHRVALVNGAYGGGEVRFVRALTGDGSGRPADR